MGLDEMTGSPNLIIVADPSDISHAAMGAGRRLDSVRRVFHRRHAISFFAAAAAAQSAAAARGADCAAWSASKSSGICCASPMIHLSDENVGAPGMRGRPLKPFRPSPAIPTTPNRTWI